MTIFFTASYYGKEKYQKYYDLIRISIEKTGVTLISPEKGNYQQVLTATQRHSLGSDRRVHYEAIRRGIVRSDCVILEISHEDFQLGHEATLAIQAKKPVLCLSIHENFEEKIANHYFHGAKYNEYTAEEIVVDFIQKTKRHHLTERFNLFLSPAQLSYLSRESDKRSLNQSELIRSLIDAARST